MSDMGFQIVPTGLGKAYTLTENSMFVSLGYAGWIPNNIYRRYNTGYYPDTTSYDILVSTDGYHPTSIMPSAVMKHTILSTGELQIYLDPDNAFNTYFNAIAYQVYLIPKLRTVSGYGISLLNSTRYLHLNEGSQISNVVAALSVNLTGRNTIKSIYSSYNYNTDTIFVYSTNQSVCVQTHPDPTDAYSQFVLVHKNDPSQAWYGSLPVKLIFMRKRTATKVLPANSWGVTLFASNGDIVLSSADSQIGTGKIIETSSINSFTMSDMSMPMILATNPVMGYQGRYQYFYSYNPTTAQIVPIPLWNYYGNYNTGTYESTQSLFIDGSMYF